MQVCLDTGGSVANDAFSFLVKCGFENIIFIGQDLAYSEQKTHSGLTYDNKDIVRFEKSDKHFLVDNIFGGQVYTEENMNIYRKWFERNVSEKDNIRFIDATEGGAKINGTEIMTFREAIDKLVKDLPETDYENTIKDIEEVSAKELEERMKKLRLIPEEIQETKSNIVKALRMYDELEGLNRKNKQGSHRFIKLTEDISLLNNAIEESIYAAFLSNISDDTEYGVLEEIYEDKSSLYEEIKLVIDSGRKVLNKYLKLYGEISEKIFNMVDDAVNKSKM